MRALCWINGTFTYQPQVSAHDRGLLVADGLFETMRVENGELADFDAHYARLSSGLKAFQLPISYNQDQLRNAAKELIQRRSLGEALCRLRLTVTRGVPGNSPSVFMSLVPQSPPATPLEVVLTGIVRVAGNPSSRYKTLAYTDNFFAQRQVMQEGKNRVAVFCNQWGRVACASIGNVFVQTKSVWLTPPVSEGALPGITRAKLLAAGVYHGTAVREGVVSVDAFLNGEVLLTNVLRGVERATAVLDGLSSGLH
jgi:branched-chain amino acid aminotransferase